MNPDDLFSAIDQVDQFAALLAGIKQKFIEHGFSPNTAEELTIMIWRQNTNA